MSELYSLSKRAVTLAILALVLGVGTVSAQWSTLPELPQLVRYHMTAVLDNKLYVFGGLNTAGNVIPDAYVLDLDNAGAGWMNIQGLPENRLGGYATAYNGKVYIISGYGSDAGTPVLRTNVIEYDPALNAYSSKAAVQYGSYLVAGARVGTKVFVMGGLTSPTPNGGTPTSRVMVYDLASDTWSQGPALPSTFFSGTGAGVGNDVYFVGGRTANQMNPGVLKLTGGTGSWTQMAGTMPAPVYDGAAGVLSNKIFVAGGTVGSTGNVTSLTQQFDPATSTWSLYFAMPNGSTQLSTMPSDGSGLYYVSGATGRSTMRMEIVPPKPIAALGPDTLNYGLQVGGSLAKRVSVVNTGTLALTGTVEIPPTAPWLSASAGNVNLQPFTSTTLEFTADATGMTPGAYTATVNLRTNDPGHPTLPLFVRLYVAQQVASEETRAVLEEATGTWCPPCGEYGIPAVQAAKDAYGERLIAIAYHDRGGGGARVDSLATTLTESMDAKLGVTAFPTAAVQRYIWNGSRMVGSNLFSAAVDALFSIQPMAPAVLDVAEYKYDAATKRVTAKLRISTTDALTLPPGGTLRLTAVVMEDSVKAFQATVTQGTLYPYYHENVVRSFWPDINGRSITIPVDAQVEGGTVVLPGKEFTVDATWTVTGVKVPRLAHVAWLLGINDASNNFVSLVQGDANALTASIGAFTTVFTTDANATKNVSPGDVAVFTSTAKNVTSQPVEITFERVSQNVPSGWSSQLCIDNDCSDASTSSVTTTVPADATVTFVLKTTAATPQATGTVTVRMYTGDTSMTVTYTTISGTAGVASESAVTGGLSMSAYPNPTSGATRIEFTNSKAGNFDVEVFAADGRRALAQAAGRFEPGTHSVTVDLSTLPAGAYTVVISATGARAASPINVAR